MRRQWSRVDVQPITWELPAAGALCWLVLAALLLPGGQGAASWLFGGAHLASIPLIYLLVALAELVLFTVTVWGVVLWWRHLGPGAMQGMARRREVERVLGLSNLRKRRKVIRPDLFDTAGAGRRS